MSIITEFFCRIVRIWEKIQTRFCFCRNRWVVTCNAKWTKWTRIWEREIGGFCCAGIVCVCVCVRERERESRGTLHGLNKNSQKNKCGALFFSTHDRSPASSACSFPFTKTQKPHYPRDMRVPSVFDISMTHFICNTSLVFSGCHLTSNSLCLSQTCFDVSLNNFSNFNVFHVQNLWLDHTIQTWLCRPET